VLRSFVGLRGVPPEDRLGGAARVKLLCVDGLELLVSWPGGCFECAGYCTVTAMVSDAGLDLRI
jgi:hypothetical protein